jgi:hypothetical protein
MAHAGPSSKSPKLDVTSTQQILILYKGSLLFTIMTTMQWHPCMFDVEELCTACRMELIAIIGLTCSSVSNGSIQTITGCTMHEDKGRKDVIDVL